jgi:biopolymer transport protein ExbD
MAESLKEDEEVISQINVTPLVDIVLVMLIVFIVTTSMVVHNSIAMNLPKAITGESDNLGFINVAISEEGTLYINGIPSNIEDIPRAVREKKEELKQKGQETLSAMVSADIKTFYGDFVKIVDKLREEGVYNVALDVKPEDSTP